MKPNFYTKFWTLVVVTIFCLSGFSIAQEIPHLQKNGNSMQLMVDGKPFLVLGAEIHNSSSSSLEYMNPIWKQLKDLNMNTALVALTWQLIEREEGKFDFSLVDGLLEDARENDLKLVFLWFGSWKNGLSHYAPLWVKEDVKRFPRVRLSNGKATETLSPLGVESRNVDAKAFAALMAHLKNVDEKQRTVIMIQVENEVGVLGATRDNSELANSEFNKEVPAELMKGLKKIKAELQPEMAEYWSKTGFKENGTWKEVFGYNNYADEVFMAWHYANYLNTVAAAGKAQYNIPMFVNTWIVQPEDTKPGDYPSGGPQSRVHDVWRIGAPEIDLKCPDVYLTNYSEILDMYHHTWNPIFIPESFSGLNGAANAFLTVGKYAGIGYSPFGIDNSIEKPSGSPLAQAYNVLNQLTPAITKAQADNKIAAFSLSASHNPQVVELGGYKIEASLSKNRRTGVLTAEKGYGLVIWTGKDEFILAGSNVNVVFTPCSSGPRMAGFDSIFEGEYVDGKWNAGRLLNGDNIMLNYDLANEAALDKTGAGAQLRAEPAIFQIKLYRFE